MINFPGSIRQKITFGYYLSLLVILAVAVLTYVNLWRVDRKVEFSGVISDFFETTLEIRRFEKNYFLFENEDDFRENQRYVARALEILGEYADGFEDITPDLSVKQVSVLYMQYGRLMELSNESVKEQAKKGAAYSRKKAALEEQVRAKGKEITEIAEGISVQESKNIRSLLSLSQRVLWLSLLVLVALGIFLGHTMATSVSRPLKVLERYTEKISRGEFVRYEGGYREKEVDSLLRAFNRMTTELEARQRQLVRSEKLASLGTLLSGVAHELNNPLSNISTSAQILSEEIEDSDIAYKTELVSQIEEQTDRARDIVRSLLEFSRESEFKKERLRLRRLLDETRVLLRSRIHAGLVIDFNVPDGLVLTADKQRMRQVFINLLSNAMDAVGEEGVIAVSAGETYGQSGERVVEIEVSDNGPGIGPELLKNIFDPFFTTKDVGHGSGLGLFIVHDIIERHGGTITVRSAPDQGTAFVIRLPQQWDQGAA